MLFINLYITNASGKFAAGIKLKLKFELISVFNGIEFIKSLSPFLIIVCKFCALGDLSIFFFVI